MRVPGARMTQIDTTMLERTGQTKKIPPRQHRGGIVWDGK